MTTVAHHRPRLHPKLYLNPVIGPPGTLVSVTGRGFPRDKLVTIFWSSSIGSVVAKTNGKGSLTAMLTILVPDLLGPRAAIAKGYRASAAFLVVPSSAQPGGSQANPIFRTEGP